MLLRSMQDSCPPLCCPRKGRGSPRQGITPTLSAEHTRQSDSHGPSCFSLLPRAGSWKPAHPRNTYPLWDVPRNTYPLWDVHWQAEKSRWKDTGRPCRAQSPPSTPSQPAQEGGTGCRRCSIPKGVQIHPGSERSSWCGKIPEHFSFHNTWVWRQDPSSSQHREGQTLRC